MLSSVLKTLKSFGFCLIALTIFPSLALAEDNLQSFNRGEVTSGPLIFNGAAANGSSYTEIALGFVREQTYTIAIRYQRKVLNSGRTDCVAMRTSPSQGEEIYSDPDCDGEDVYFRTARGIFEPVTDSQKEAHDYLLFLVDQLVILNQRISVESLDVEVISNPAAYAVTFITEMDRTLTDEDPELMPTLPFFGPAGLVHSVAYLPLFNDCVYMTRGNTPSTFVMAQVPDCTINESLENFSILDGETGEQRTLSGSDINVAIDDLLAVRDALLMSFMWSVFHRDLFDY
jgi:hypothetical protein